MQDSYDYEENSQQNTQPSIAELTEQGRKLDAQLWDPFFGYSETDYLMDKYPALKPQIQEGIKRGIPVRILGKVIRERIEPQLNFMGRPDQVNKLLQRTPETMQTAADYDYIKSTFNQSQTQTSTKKSTAARTVWYNCVQKKINKKQERL